MGFRSRHGWIGAFVRDFENNPDLQWKIHRIGMYFWLVNFPAVTVVFFVYPREWLRWGLYITLMYSIYANFSTDYGAMSAAEAVDRPNHVEGVVALDSQPPVAIEGDLTIEPPS